MSTYSFESTGLWRRTLAEREGDSDAETRGRFRVAFLKARAAVAPLVAQISAQLPGLTVHDITHLDALWDVADLIIGPDFEVSPAEAFVLGMAFLLHDAATSTAAFANGVDELRSTVEWKDFIAQRNWTEVVVSPGSSEYQYALFEVLRLLHPRQAEKLLSIQWKFPNGSAAFLLDDVQLRNHYGHVIGRIAHSHWWDVGAVEDEWAASNPVSLHSSLVVRTPSEWRVDLFKVALVLRCTDAAHIDGRRAPDMVAAILKPGGTSAFHWLFQNRLGLPDLNLSNELYWSAGQPFSPQDAEPWWLCYDTARMVDREIRSSQRLLANNGRQSFKARGVAGAQYIAEFASSVTVEGWHPIDVNFKATKVGEIIEKFGGARLYGKEPWRALKELLQNAADAIRARRLKRGVTGGEICVSLSESSGEWWLEVRDNGLGMSSYVLTDVLLDFGRSLWTDASVRRQHPGLMAAGFKPVGQFGIGFLSVFMLGDEVEVTSWKDGDSEENQSTLRIPQRTSARPVLVKTPIEQRLSEFGTRIRVRLRGGLPSLLPEVHHWKKAKDYWELGELVGALVPTIDINVYCSFNGSRSLIVSANDWLTLAEVELMKRIAPRLSSSNVELFDVKEADGLVVGRLGHGGSNYWSFNFGVTPAVLTHKGILVGGLGGVRGILMAENNYDLARTEARPSCSAFALMAWARASKDVNLRQEWLRRPETDVLLSCGLSPSEIKLNDAGDVNLSVNSVREWIVTAGFTEVFILTGDVDVPDDISKEEFRNEFTLFKNVVRMNSDAARRTDFGLKGWIEELVPEEPSKPRTTSGVFRQLVQAAFPHAAVEDDYFPVGTVYDREIEAACIRVTFRSDD